MSNWMKGSAVMVVFAAMTAAANASVIANWTFETSVPTTAGPVTAEAGDNFLVSQAQGMHVGVATYSSPAGNGSPHSYSVNTWAVGDYWQFSTSTTGYAGISIQWDQTSSATGPRDFNLFWSTDGTNFTPIGGTMAVLANTSPNAWSAGTPVPAATIGPIAAPANLDNQGTIYFRLVDASTTSANGGTVATAGTDRVDNVIISAVPTPGAISLLGLGGLLAARRRR
jgi:hypothetical protein